MLYHVRCNNPVGIKGGIEVISQIGINSVSKTLTTTGYYVAQVKSTKVEKDFYCPECLTIVTPDEIYVTCAACGDRLSPEIAHVIRGAGAILCPSHIKRYAKTDETFLLSEIINSLKGK